MGSDIDVDPGIEPMGKSILHNSHPKPGNVYPGSEWDISGSRTGNALNRSRATRRDSMRVATASCTEAIE